MGINYFNNLARRVYLSIVCCPEQYAWQEPECEFARWYHLFFLFMPIVGIVMFVESIKH